MEVVWGGGRRERGNYIRIPCIHWECYILMQSPLPISWEGRICSKDCEAAVQAKIKQIHGSSDLEWYMYCETQLTPSHIYQ